MIASDTSEKQSSPTPIIKFENVTKTFPGVVANNDVSLEIRKGEIHTLLGENGAGKSTLMKVLYGLYQHNKGKIWVNGRETHFKNAHDATAMHTGMIHQHFTLVDSFTVAESIFLGKYQIKDMLKNPRNLFFNHNEKNREVEKLANEFGFQIDPAARIWQLSAGEKQRVEILKAMSSGIEILILDEATSVLAPQEVQDFFKVLRNMNKKGLTIIFITHILEEALQISDRITVLRDGKLINTLDNVNLTKKQLANLMVGRDVLFEYARKPQEPGPVILSVENLTAKTPQKLIALKKITFEVRSGEIYGIAGIAGNGQSELADVLSGNRKALEGRITIDGIDVTNKPPKYFIQHGLSYIPEDRMLEGVALKANLVDNTLLSRILEPCFCEKTIIKWDEVRSCTETMIEEYNVVSRSSSDVMENLSGGNIQKFILARELSKDQKLIIAVHPTMGLDVAATEEIRKRLLSARDNQKAILLISESLEEIQSISDRIGVLFKGKLVKEFLSSVVDVNEIGYYMLGGKEYATNE